jgi:peroxiredoxin
MLVLAIATQVQVFIAIRKAQRAGTFDAKEFKDKYGTLIQDLNLSRPFAV